MRHILQRLGTRSQRTAAISPLVSAAALFERVRAATDTAHDRGEPCSLIHISVDEYRAAVHRGGYEAGDRLLQQVSATLAEACQGAECFASLRPAEFAVYLPGADVEDAARVGDHILNALGGVSTGAVTWRDGAASMTSVVQQGYQAMYEARRAGTGEYRHLVLEGAEAVQDRPLSDSASAGYEASVPGAAEHSRQLATVATASTGDEWDTATDWTDDLASAGSPQRWS